MTHWKRYVDDTIAVIKLASTENVLPTLNKFLIKFTYELEQKRMVFIYTGNLFNQELGNFACFGQF